MVTVLKEQISKLFINFIFSQIFLPVGPRGEAKSIWTRQRPSSLHNQVIHKKSNSQHSKKLGRLACLQQKLVLFKVAILHDGFYWA